VPNRAALVKQIKAKARRLGFALAGIVPASSSTTIGHYHAWLENGYHGQMAYLARPDAVAKRAAPARIQPDTRTVVVVGMNHHTSPLPAHLRDDPSRGIIASYAWGSDYHEVMVPRLRELGALVTSETGQEAGYRAYVDTGPLLERELAARAGLGFVGKNTNLIHPRLGSWLFLGELLLTIELPATPLATSQGTCGRCTRCLDACPTGAFVAPYVLDARRCISYLTIELKGAIPPDLRPLMGHWIYGCDVCQQVCPWQRFAEPTQERAFLAQTPSRAVPLLTELMELNEETFQRQYAGTPILRIGRARLLRNAAVALGNWGDERAVPALKKALSDPEPLVRDHATWALGQVGQ
jgi:epoxyqueuosine reductase